MKRLVACFSLSVAVLASASFGLAAELKKPSASLGTPTPITSAVSEALPMPGPLPSEIALPSLQPTFPELNATPTPMSPVPEIQYSGPVGQLPVVTGPSIELYPCVKYRDTRKIAPCAVPIIVQVPEPQSLHDRLSCCPRQCVNVEICVPSTGCPKVCVTRNGDRTRYDYGDYAVNITSGLHRIVVDYDF